MNNFLSNWLWSREGSTPDEPTASVVSRDSVQQRLKDSDDDRRPELGTNDAAFLGSVGVHLVKSPEKTSGTERAPRNDA